MTRSLADIDADIATLDVLLLPLGDFDTAEAEAPGLLDRLAGLYRERDHALARIEAQERPQVA